jgi:hypothetical protein
VLDLDAATDRDLVTGRGPDDLDAFCDVLLGQLALRRRAARKRPARPPV